MPEVLNVPVFLDNIRNNDKYREELIAIAPDIKADIVSFQGNQNCGCRRKIQQYVDQNKETEPIKAFFSTWTPQIPNLFITPRTVNQAVTSTPNGNVTVEATQTPPAQPTQAANAQSVKVMQGHVVEIPASPDEYKNLLDHARKDRWVYRGLSVMTKDDKWLVFFY